MALVISGSGPGLNCAHHDLKDTKELHPSTSDPFVVVGDRVSLCVSGYPGTRSVVQPGLEFRDSPASSAGIKSVCHHRLAHIWSFLFDFGNYSHLIFKHKIALCLYIRGSF